MKSILISIQPQWVEKILNGEKTIEIRNTVPKEWKEYLKGKSSIKPEPSKWYIYCTQSKPYLHRIDDDNKFELTTKIRFEEDCFVKDFNAQNGKVVAEFTLNEVDILEFRHLGVSHVNCYIPVNENADYEWEKHSCINYKNIVDYGKLAPIFALHIEDLKIYDKPKELSKFIIPNKKNCKTCFLYKNMCENACEEVKLNLFKAPQSWCYVEGDD